jgi:hypothetical protein
MEIPARNSQARRLLQHVVMFPVFFVLFFGVYALIEHGWRPLWRTALSAGMMSAVFAALYPVKRFRRPKLGGAPRSC